MKRLLLTGLLCVLGNILFAKNGYKIEIKFKQDMPDE